MSEDEPIHQEESEIAEPVRRTRSAREILDSMRGPNNALEAFAIILATEAAAVEERRVTPEQSRETLRAVSEGIKKENPQK